MFLAAVNSNIRNPVSNPYFSATTSMPPRFASFKNVAGWTMYLVTRLDGPTAKIAAGLVTKRC